MMPPTLHFSWLKKPLPQILTLWYAKTSVTLLLLVDGLTYQVARWVCNGFMQRFVLIYSHSQLLCCLAQATLHMTT